MGYVREEIRVANWINFLIGLWLVMAPFLVWFTDLSNAMWSSIVIGVALMLVSLAEAARPGLLRILAGMSLLLGLWLFVAPIILGFVDSLAPTLIHVVMGLMVTVLAGGSLLRSVEKEPS